jgi:DNA-binding PadR family transcriptional regulator
MDATWRSFYEISMRTRLLGADIAPALNFLVLTGSAESQRVRDPDIPKRRYTEYRLTDKGLEAASEFRSTLGK